MFLFQFEKSGQYFVITSYNRAPTPDGKSRFCTGLQFGSREEARKYVEDAEAMRRTAGALLQGTDSVGGKWKAKDEARRGESELERKYSGKCQKVVFDIPFSKEPGIKDRVYTRKEVSNVQYENDIGSNAGRQPLRIA
jgi:hypothetical protein